MFTGAQVYQLLEEEMKKFDVHQSLGMTRIVKVLSGRTGQARSAEWTNIYYRPAEHVEMPTKAPRNDNFAKLSAGYLFPVVAKKRRDYAAAHPDAKVISLGVGDTTHPLPAPIAEAMASYSKGLGTHEGYEGYDPKSEATLKVKIAEVDRFVRFLLSFTVSVNVKFARKCIRVSTSNRTKFL